jgi:hypothetical protein
LRTRALSASPLPLTCVISFRPSGNETYWRTGVRQGYDGRDSRAGRNPLFTSGFEVDGGADEPHVAEGLGEAAEQVAAGRVDPPVVAHLFVPAEEDEPAAEER